MVDLPLSLLLLSGQIGSHFGYGMKRTETDGSPEIIHEIRFGKRARASASITRIVHPLTAVALRATLLYSDAVFEIRRVPGGTSPLGNTGVQQLKRVTLKVRFTDRVLNNDPCRLGAILPGNIFRRPAMQLDQLAQARGILNVDTFHARNVFSAKFSGAHKLPADAEVFLAHGEKLAAQSLIGKIRRHGEIVSRRCRRRLLPRCKRIAPPGRLSLPASVTIRMRGRS